LVARSPQIIQNRITNQRPIVQLARVRVHVPNNKHFTLLLQ
jgi:hypothetical protein